MRVMGARYVPLFWRIFIPNVTILGVACVVLVIEPANGRVPALVGGLIVMLLANLLVLRWAVMPLARFTGLMRAVDPLRPGQRVTTVGPESEVTVLGEAFNEMLDRLEQERLQSGRRALSEREAERRRIAAELHDEVGQSLTAAVLQVERHAERCPGGLREEATAVRDALTRTIEDVRGIAARLRPEALDALGLIPALTNLTERLAQQTGIRIERDLQRGLPSLSDDAELVIYRVAQESITNAIRHAGAGVLELRLREEDGEVRLSVRDDGCGFDPAGVAESGIRAMRERALAVGATLRVGPRPDGPGTEVRLAVGAG
jgi:two-component system, NarL family, sensor histidine kinase UhpB